MGFFGKLLFWRRKKKLELAESKLEDLPPIPNLQPRYNNLGMPQSRQREQPYSPFESSQPQYQQADNTNLQIISNKLDIINSKLEVLNQRLSQLEMRWQSKEQPRW